MRGIRQLPRTLEAVTAFEQDDLGRRVMGEELYRSYIDLKKSEWWSYHNSISQWEIDRVPDQILKPRGAAVFWRKKAKGANSEVKMFFASDLHGSNVCFKKFINSAKF